MVEATDGVSRDAASDLASDAGKMGGGGDERDQERGHRGERKQRQVSER